MKKLILPLLLIYCPHLIWASLTWTDEGPFATIRPAQGQAIATTYNTSTNELFATWNSSVVSPGFFTAATFNGTTWSVSTLPTGIPAVSPNGDVFNCYFPDQTKIVATWKIDTTNKLGYAVYNGSSWASFTESSIDISGTDFSVCYSTLAATVVGTYEGPNIFSPFMPPNIPYGATFSGGSWGGIHGLINTGTTPSGLVNCSNAPFNSAIKAIAVWRQDSSSNLFYATFDGSNWNIQDGSPFATNATVTPFVAFDPDLGKIVATYTDTSNNPHYAIYDPTNGWVDQGPITTSSLVEANTAVIPAFDATNHQMVATWQDSSHHPVSATSTTLTGSWSSDGEFATGTDVLTNSSVVPCYYPPTGQMVATWIDVNNFAHYAVTGGSTPTTSSKSRAFGRPNNNR